MCCAMTQTKALLYTFWLLMINTLFVEQISCQINFFAENIKRSFFSLWRRLSINHMPGNEKDQVSLIWRYGTSLWDFRHCRTMVLKVYINGRENGWKPQKGTQTCTRMNFSPTCCQNLNVNAVQRSTARVIWYCKGKNYYGFCYMTGQNRGLSGLKSIWPVILTGNLLSVILSPVQCKAFPKFWVFLYN